MWLDLASVYVLLCNICYLSLEYYELAVYFPFLVEELLPFGVEFTVSIPVLNISRHWQLTILDRELLVEPSCDTLIQASYAEI